VAPLLASSDGIYPSLNRAVQQAADQPPAGDEVPAPPLLSAPPRSAREGECRSHPSKRAVAPDTVALA